MKMKKLLSALMSAVIIASSTCAAQLATSVTAHAGFGLDKISTSSEANQKCFEEISKAVKEIAAGERSDATVKVNVLYNEIDTKEILNTILAEYPYELYWFDKAVGMSAALSASDITFQFTVSAAYRGASTYSTDTEKTKAAAAVADKAKSIVEANKNKSDFDKLKAYKKAICDLVEYNYAAAENGSASNNNPWQIVYVFDEDPSTNVVCEGYSKAFQYLCDLTTFNDNTIRCASVSGTMNGAYVEYYYFQK